MGGYCVVSGCKNRGGHTFPNDKKLKKAWIDRVQREASWKPSKHSTVCTSHFLPDDYLTKNIYGQTALKKQLRAGAVPSVFWWKKPDHKKVVRNQQRERRREERHAGIAEEEELQRRLAAAQSGSEVDAWIEEFQRPDHIPEAKSFEEVESAAVPARTDQLQEPAITAEEPVDDIEDGGTASQSTATVTTHKSSQCDFRSGFFSVQSLRKPDDLRVITGVMDASQFNLLLAMFEPAFQREMCNKKRSHDRNLSFANRLALTLTKLRHNITCELLGTLYDVSPTSAALIFRSTIRLMHSVLRHINFWPEVYDQRLPVVIIDCTELRISRPSNPALQSLTYSTYKSANTVKILIGITPKGAISFVSDAFSGSSSDQQVFERSGLLDLLKEGDIVLADRGFNIQHHVAYKGVKVVTPAFMKGRAQLLAAEVVKSRMITRQRIHVERLIGLTKTFKFVKGPIHYRHVPIISEAYSVACFLGNLRPAIVK